MVYHLGIDLGGTKIAAGVVDADYRLTSMASCPTGAGRCMCDVLDDVERVAQEAADKAGLPLSALDSLGMGTPSTINPKTGLLVFANAMGWKNAPVRQEMIKRFDRPVFFGNDADCAALGETLAGAGRGADNILMVTLGTGIGGGIILDRKIFNGCDQMGAEIGHTILVFDGEPCTCGKRGCLEAYASGTALVSQIKTAISLHPESALAHRANTDQGCLTGKIAFDCAREGDPVAARVLDTYTSYVAAGISSLVTIFRPERILVGGGICSQGKALLEPLNLKLSRYVYAYTEIGAPPVLAAELGNSAGIIGAAMLEAHMTPGCVD